MGHPVWPLYDLRLRTPRLELRLPNEDELAALCVVARAGVHAPDQMPFSVPWSIKESPRFEREFVQFHWLGRATWSVASWNLDLVVFLDGRPIGSQGVFARNFAVLKQVGTGSWLGSPFQGNGYGKEVRAVVLGFAFDHLGAEVAVTKAFVDNAASSGVSRSLGYEANGITRQAPEGVARELNRFRMTRDGWRSRERPPLAVEGLEGCRALFGG